MRSSIGYDVKDSLVNLVRQHVDHELPEGKEFMLIVHHVMVKKGTVVAAYEYRILGEDQRPTGIAFNNIEFSFQQVFGM